MILTVKYIISLVSKYVMAKNPLYHKITKTYIIIIIPTIHTLLIEDRNKDICPCKKE